MSNDLVVIDNAVVNAAYELSLNEQRLILAAIAQIPKGEAVEANRAYCVTREDFIRAGVHPDNVAREIRTAASDLLKKTLFIDTEIGALEFNWLSEVLRYDKKAEEKLKAKYPNPEDYNKYIQMLRAYNLLDSFAGLNHKDDNVVIRLVFHERIVPFLTELKKNFTQFSIDDVAGFGSTYSIRIYQMMMQFKSTGYRKITLEELRYALALGEKYPLVADLKRWVVDTAVKEINKKSPYNVNYEMLKTGRKYTHIEIKFEPKQIDTPNMIDVSDSDPTGEEIVPSWKEKGLSDKQINKLSIYKKAFIDANSSMIAPNERRGYDEVFEEWRNLLKDPSNLTDFNKIQELLDRKQ